MERLTPEQFYEQNRERFLYQIPAKPQSICIQELMQSYADHLEETAWVTDGSLPPKEDEESSIVVELLVVIEPKILDDKKRIRTGYYDFEEKRWYMTFADESISFEVFSWRHLPNPPKNQ